MKRGRATIRARRALPACRSIACMLKTALLSGGLAGLAGLSRSGGPQGQSHPRSVARLRLCRHRRRHAGLLHPLGVIAAAIFVAGVFVGADAMSRRAGVPSYIAQVMVAASLLAMVVAIMFTRYRCAGDNVDAIEILLHGDALGGGDPHCLAAHLRHAGRAHLRARRRPQSRHRRHHDGRRLCRLVHRLSRRRSVVGVLVAALAGAAFGCCSRAGRAARPVAACDRHRHHAARHAA